MTERKYIPEGKLATFVKCMWYSDGYTPLVRKERVLPCGASQLIINLGNETFRRFEDPDFEEAREYDPVILAGVHSGFIFLDAFTRTSTIGVVLRPGGIGALLNMPAAELQDQVVALDAILQIDATSLRQKLIEAGTPEDKFALLESFLTDRLNKSFLPNPAIAYAVEQLKSKKGIPSISEVRDKIGYSRRWFAELFGTSVGVTPKQYARICRFQHVLQKIKDNPAPDWSEMALANGYYDQAHLINDFRSLSGLTPTKYFRHKTDTVNHLSV